MGVAENLRGPLPERERNSIIGLNIRYAQREAIKTLKYLGKTIVIYSPYREFIYGDGFFHNIRSPVQPGFTPKLLVPLTPRISVLYVRPRCFLEEPKLCTLVVSVDEANELNNTIQVYAKEAVFYRSEQPKLIDDYRCNAHKCYADSDNSIELLISGIPGVLPIHRFGLF